MPDRISLFCSQRPLLAQSMHLFSQKELNCQAEGNCGLAKWGKKIPCGFPSAAAVRGGITDPWQIQGLRLAVCTWLKSSKIIKIKGMALVSHHLTGDQCSLSYRI